MSLPAREQQVLDGIETVLQDSEATLTAMFGLFTRLAAGEAKPRIEEFRLPSERVRPPLRAVDLLNGDAERRSPAPGRLPARKPAAGRRRARWPAAGRWLPADSAEYQRVVILLVMLVLAVAAVAMLSRTATSTRICAPATSTQAYESSALSPAASCPASPAVPAPTQVP
jgi:hypothetical protein